MTDPHPEVVCGLFTLVAKYGCIAGEFPAACDLVVPAASQGRPKRRRSRMIRPRPEVIDEVRNLARRCGCTGADLHAACDLLKLGVRRGPPENKSYGRFLWAMYALVAVYGRDRFTAAKQILSLADKPVHQRDYQARALVRRFDKTYKEGESVAAEREFYARAGAGERISMFYNSWKFSKLPWPPDIKSPTDLETELRMLAMTAGNQIYTVHRNYEVALDELIAASKLGK